MSAMSYTEIIRGKVKQLEDIFHELKGLEKRKGELLSEAGRISKSVKELRKMHERQDRR
jgi:hypothetical protein